MSTVLNNFGIIISALIYYASILPTNITQSQKMPVGFAKGYLQLSSIAILASYWQVALCYPNRVINRKHFEILIVLTTAFSCEKCMEFGA